MQVGSGGVLPVGDSQVASCQWTGGTCMLPQQCGHLAAPRSFPPPAEAEWIWDSEEVVNLHLGDMSLEQRRKKKNPNKLTKKALTGEEEKKR